jgi:hypothetical protein
MVSNSTSRQVLRFVRAQVDTGSESGKHDQSLVLVSLRCLFKLVALPYFAAAVAGLCTQERGSRGQK